jgi:hypothetical protein
LNIDALIVSCGEPQLLRCLAGIHSQTVKPNALYHQANIVPESTAFRTALEKIGNNWTLHLGGDTIPYENAIETASSFLNADGHGEKVCSYCFGLLDTFLQINIGYCHLFNPVAYREVKYTNRLDSDQNANNALRKMGWKIMKFPSTIIGTHFDQPDDFQVFRRFYAQSKKFPTDQSATTLLLRGYSQTNDPLYLTGIKAIKFSRKSEPYPGSHNIEYDRRMYEEFKKQCD